MYCWSYIKVLEFTVTSLNLRFPNENIYTFLFNPNVATCPHRIIFLNYIPQGPSVERYNSCSLHCAQSCQSTLHFHMSLSHSTLLWNIVSLRAIQGFRHDAADVRVTLSYYVANDVRVFLSFGINIRFYSQAYNITKRQKQRWTKGWMDGCLDGWMNGCDGWMDGRFDGWMNARMNGWIDGRMLDGRINGWMNEWMDVGWMDEWTLDGWMNEWMDG